MSKLQALACFFEKSLSVVIIFFVFIIKCHCQMHLEVLASGFKPASQPQIPVKQRNSEGNVGMETSKKCSETGESTNMKLQEHQMSHCVTRWSFAKSEIMGRWLPTGGVPRSHLIPNSYRESLMNSEFYHPIHTFVEFLPSALTLASSLSLTVSLCWNYL